MMMMMMMIRTLILALILIMIREADTELLHASGLIEQMEELTRDLWRRCLPQRWQYRLQACWQYHS